MKRRIRGVRSKTRWTDVGRLVGGVSGIVAATWLYFLAFGPSVSLTTDELRATASVALGFGILRGIAAIFPAGLDRLKFVLLLAFFGAPVVMRGPDFYWNSAPVSWWILAPALVLFAGLIGQDLLSSLDSREHNDWAVVPAETEQR